MRAHANARTHAHACAQRQYHFRRDLYRLTAGPLQKLRIIFPASTIAPASSPILRVAANDLLKSSHLNQVTPHARRQWPISELKPSPSSGFQGPASSDPKFIFPQPPPHFVPTTLAYLIFSDTKDSPTQALPTACNAFPRDGHMANSLPAF